MEDNLEKRPDNLNQPEKPTDDVMQDISSETDDLTAVGDATADKGARLDDTDSVADDTTEQLSSPKDAPDNEPLREQEIPNSEKPVPTLPVDDRNAKLDNAMASIGSKAKGVLATKNGKIGACIIAAALVVMVLFTSHTICFHDWKEATCTDPEICTKCGRSQGEPLGHEWKEATCTEPKTCDRCGKTEGKALGHEATEWKVASKATCTSEGEEQGECIRCGEIQYRSIAKLPHEFGKWSTTKEPSCTDEGESTRKCKNCGETETKSIEMVDHQPGDWEIDTPARIDGMGGTTPGTKVRKCTVCGQVVDEETYDLSAEEAFDEFAGECLSPSYEDVARDPESYRGINVIFKGEVIQVLQDGNDYTLRVNVTNTGHYWTDTIMVYYTAQPGDQRILEDDVISFYGPMHGMYTYESILGAEITVPLMEAYYIRY